MKNNYINLISVWIISKLRDVFFPKKVTSNLKKINQFKLTKRIDTHKKTRDFVLGQYEYKSKYYFIKTWLGEIKDFSYYNLIYEYKLSAMLSKSKYQKYISTKFLKPTKFIKDNNRISVVYPFVFGNKLSTYSIAYQEKVMNLVLDDLSVLSQKIDKDTFILFSVRNKYFYIVYAFVGLLKVVLTGRKNIKVLCKIVYLMCKDFVKGDNNSIAHGDLHPDNIIISNDKIYLLDCENMMITIPNYDRYNLLVIDKYSKLSNRLFRNFGSHNFFILITVLINSSEHVLEEVVNKLSLYL